MSKRNLSEQNLYEILKKNETGLNFTKDRDETNSNYAPHSTTSYGFKKRIRTRYVENDDWDKVKEKRFNQQNKPQLTRVIFKSNRPNDPLSNDIYKKHYDPILTTEKVGIQTSRNFNSNGNQQQYSTNYELSERNSQQEQLPNKQKFFGNQNHKQDPNLQTNPVAPSGFNRKYITKSNSIGTPKSFYSTQLPNKFPQTKSGYGKQNQDYFGEGKKKEQDNADSERKQNQEDQEYQQNQRNPYYDYENEIYDDAEEQAIFDQISNQDWYKLLPEEVINNKNIDIDKFFIDNSEYFYNLLCQNAQMRSTKPFFFNNDNTTAKLKYNPAFNTTYNKNFFKKTQQFPNNPQLTDKMMQTNFLGLKQIDYTSQKQNDYKDHGIKGVERRVHTYQPSHKPFMGLTSYNSNFINWRDYKKQFDKVPHHISTKSDIPFLGKTSYQDAFNINQTQKGEVAEIDRNRLFKGPIPTYPLFFGETNYASTFRPFQVKAVSTPQANNTNGAGAAPQSDRYTKNDNEQMIKSATFSQIPSYQGQFKSMTQKDFGAYKDERFFASSLKKLWRSKIQKKLEELREIKNQKQLEELS